MMTKEQAINDIERIILEHKEAVTKRDDESVKSHRQKFSEALTEYRDVIGAKAVKQYINQVSENSREGGYLPKN